MCIWTRRNNKSLSWRYLPSLSTLLVTLYFVPHILFILWDSSTIKYLYYLLINAPAQIWMFVLIVELLFWTKYISKLRVTNNIKICFDKTALTWEHNNWGSKIIGASWFWILDRKHLFSFKIRLWMDILILRHSGQAIENIFEDIWRFRDYCICNLIIMIMTSDLFVTIAEALYFW